MPSASCAANSPLSAPFPPEQRAGFHDAVIAEILQERVVSSRNRRNPRGVKRKMSKFPIRRKTHRAPPPINLAEAIQILI
jgi:hypothetical protein